MKIVNIDVENLHERLEQFQRNFEKRCGLR